ncbi:MAG TPA: DEAD/DEAH box helicase [Candidatus Deferrimicrobium sp.]|nr:DEAD/DEAH box helicase [Candidatus Deferrimicrobium sp.]
MQFLDRKWMKSIFNLEITDLPIENKFKERFKSSGFLTFFPPQALGALTIFNMPIIDKIVEFDEKVYEEYQIPLFKLLYEKVQQIDRINPPLGEDLRQNVKLRENFLFSIPTGVGKTLLGMLAAIKALPYKTIWCFTLKAIANEKYMDFKEIFEQLGLKIGIKTGDYSTERDNYLKNYDWIIATPEAADSLLTSKPSWLNEVKLVVLDEIHLVRDEERGFKYEDVVAKSKYHNFNLVGLSATVSNAVELARWLDANLIFSDWRMVPLKKGILFGRQIIYSKQETQNLRRYSPDDAVNATINFLENDEQVLCFVDSRTRIQEKAKKCIEILKKQGWKPNDEIAVPDTESGVGELLNEMVKYHIAFHMAGLSLVNRKAIEDLFRAGAIKAIWATPTLAAGVNLPAKRVIQDGYKRASRGRWTWLPVIEMHQRWGRAGRPQYDKMGYGYVVARKSSADDTGERLTKDQEIERLIEKYVLGEPEPVTSKYLVETNLYCSLLRCIRANYAKTMDQILQYYKYTLSNIQYPKSKEIILEALDFLDTNGFIARKPKLIRSTPYGNLTSDLYIHPITALTYSNGLKLIDDRPDPITLIFIVCMAPDAITLPIRMQEETGYWYFYEENKILFPMDIEDSIQLRAVKTAMVLDDYMKEVPIRALEEKYNINIGDLTPIVSQLGYIPWLFNALAKLAIYHKRTDLIPRIEVLGKRITYGVKEERLPLINLQYVSRERAIALQNAGYRTIESIANANLAELREVKVKGFKLGNWADRILKNANKHLEMGRNLEQEYSPDISQDFEVKIPRVIKKKPSSKYKQQKLIYYD